MAPECGIDSVRTVGDYGPIVSSSRDASVFLRYAQTGRWAESTNATFGEFFDRRGKGVYLDIGANIGLTTIPIAQRPSVACFAFEPEPENFRNLSINVNANCMYDHVRLFQTALFDRNAELEFELAPNNLGDHRIRTKPSLVNLQGENERRTITVTAVPLDDIVLDVAGSLAVKIDVQGAEPFVIAGGRRTIANADLLVLEWAPYHIARMGGDHRAILAMLRQSFLVARIAEAERAPSEVARPIGDVCDQLEETFGADSSRPSRYFDIVATKA
jgi:FkbM family methyltransferase